MRRTRAVLLGLWLLTPAFGGVARAQLPLPQMNDGPELRFASTDAFRDEVQSALQRTERKHEDRRQKIDRGRSLLKSQIRQFELSADPTSDIEPPKDFDILVAEKLSAALDQEETLLEQSLDLVRRALETIKDGQSAAVDTQPISFDELLQLGVSAEKLEKEDLEALEAVRRLQSLGALEDPAGLGDSTEARLISQESAVLAAQLTAATARELLIRARARNAKQRLLNKRDDLRVTSADVDAAKRALHITEDEVATALKDIAVQKAELRKSREKQAPKIKDPNAARRYRSASRSLRLTQFDLLSRREETLKTKVLSAKMRLNTLRALAEGSALKLSRELASANIEIRSARVERAQSQIEQLSKSVKSELVALPESSLSFPLLKARVDGLTKMHETLSVTQTYLHRMTTMAELGEGAQRRLAMPAWLAVVLSLLVALGGFGLMTLGLKQTNRLILSEKGLARFWPKHAKRLDTAFALLWPLLVMAICSAVIIWPIWDLDVSFIGAIKLIDRPLFFVDGTGVSVFSIIQFLFAIWASVVLSQLVRDFLNGRVYRNLGWDIGLTNALNTLVHYATLLVGIIVGLRFVGIGLSSLALFAGILGIGIGFGLRNITENFISGLIILAERPVKIGDFVEVEEGKFEGQVQSIRARSTTVVTRDNISIIIPNSNFVSSKVINWSHGDPKVRIVIPVGVVYGSDTGMVRKTLLEVATRHKQVLKKPQPEVQFHDFGASSLDFLLLVWVDEQFHRFRIASDLRFAIDKAFGKVGLEIAFPQMDLHLKSVSENAKLAMFPIPEPGPEPPSEDLENRLEQIRSAWPNASKGPSRASSSVARAASRTSPPTPVPIPEALKPHPKPKSAEKKKKGDSKEKSGV